MQILGLATAAPGARLDQADAAVFAQPYNCATPRQRRLLGRVYAQSGIHGRHVVVAGMTAPTVDNPMTGYYPLPGEDTADAGPTIADRMQQYQQFALPLAEQACHAALSAAGIGPHQVSQIVLVSCTGLAAPGVDLKLIDRLPLPRTVGRTMIGFMGCHGALNGLRVTRGLTAADPQRPVLMCCVELCSLHFRYGWDRDRIVANALFADGAAALVARWATAPLVARWATSPQAPLKLLASGSVVLPDSADAMTWIIGDHGFEMTLSSRVPDLIHAHLRSWLEPFLADHDLSLDDIGSFAVHPGGPRVLDAVEDALDLRRGAVDASRAVLAEQGNMSSPTVLFILDRLRQQAAPRPILAMAFGPGLTAEAAIFT
jgi:predicted naringenin-chalcone synthase